MLDLPSFRRETSVAQLFPHLGAVLIRNMTSSNCEAWAPASRRRLHVRCDRAEPLLGAFGERKRCPDLGVIQPVDLLPEISQESFRKLPVRRL